MGIAYIGSPSPAATLWSIVPEPSKGRWGTLYGYGVNLSTGGLNYWWDSGTIGLANCPTHPTATGWLTTSFTEPTVANGAAYVPTACVVTSGGPYAGCEAAVRAKAPVASGVLAFSACQ